MRLTLQLEPCKWKPLSNGSSNIIELFGFKPVKCLDDWNILKYWSNTKCETCIPKHPTSNLQLQDFHLSVWKKVCTINIRYSLYIWFIMMDCSELTRSVQKSGVWISEVLQYVWDISDSSNLRLNHIQHNTLNLLSYLLYALVVASVMFKSCSNILAYSNELPIKSFNEYTWGPGAFGWF